MKRRLVVPMIMVVLLLAACKNESIKKAAKASDDMAVTVGLAIDVKRQLALSVPPLISQDEELKLTLGLQKVNTAVTAFHHEVRRLSKLDPQAKGNLSALLTSIVQAVNELNQQAVLGINNPDSKAKVQAVLAGLNVSFSIIRAVLEGP